MAIQDDMQDVQEAVINELITENGITNTLADGQVTETKILNNSVTTNKIANGAVTAAKLGSDVDLTLSDGEVTETKIADGAVTTNKIANGEVTAAKLGSDVNLTPADGSITPAKLDRAYLESTNGVVTGTLDVNGGIVCSPNTEGKDTFELSTHAADEGRLRIKNIDTTTVQIRAGGDSYFNGGDVGIGTASITSSASNRTVLELNGASTSLFNISIGGARKAYLYHDNSSFYIDNVGNTPMKFLTHNTERMRIQGDGTIILYNVPTSSTGLPTGAIYRSSGYLKIVT